MSWVIAQRAVPHGDGCVEVVSRWQLTGCRHWRSAFGVEAKDRRYYELVEDTLHREFDYRYFVVRDTAGEICAVQPFFVLDLDLLIGTRPRFGRAIDAIRRFWPRFMRARTLMVGCAAGEGHVDGQDEFAQARSARLLASAIVGAARQLKARLVVLKEFPAKYRSMLQCFIDKNFTRIPSMPNVQLNIDYASFDDYMTRALSGGARRKLRLKLRAAETAPPIEMSVIDDIAPIIDEVYPLYLAVHDRSNLRFETLTKEYFCALGRRLGDKNRFFVWRQNGKAVAFGSCLVQGDAIHAEYLGLDYTIALRLHLYHYTFRDLISWGIANGYKWFNSTSLNYDPKLHLRYLLAPIDLYVRHTSAIWNTLLSRLLPWLEPTRYDATLKQFANYDELWAPTDPAGRAAIGTGFAAVAQSSHAALSALAKLPQKLREQAAPAMVGVGKALDPRTTRLWAPLSWVAVATAIVVAVDASLQIPHLTFAYLLPILYAAVRFGRIPALAAIVASGLCAVFFLYEPRLSLRIDDSADIVELAVFCGLAMAISQALGRQPDRGLKRSG